MDIWLYFDSKGIKQQQWEAVWNECYEVLQCFPVPLAVSDSEKKWGYTRYVWKTQLIEVEDDEKCLCIQSDMASLEFGDRYRLYHDLAQYEGSKKKRDILLSIENKDDSIDRFCIWANRTSGAPYSLAVLALGILLENRFPANCCMYGFDYTNEHVEYMRAWLSGALDTNMRLPVCNDSEYLWERLMPLFPDINALVHRYCKLSKSPKRKNFEFLIAKGCSDALQNELIRQMNHYSSVAQWGVTDWLYPYLEATNDVEQVAILIKRMQEKSGKKDFSLEELLKTLLDEGITVNPVKSEITKQWNDTGDTLVTSMEGLNRLILRMGGLPNRIDYYISPDELLEIFGCMEPANGVKFKKIIEQQTRKCLKDYQKMEETTEKMAKQLSKTKGSKKSDVTEIMACWERRRNLPFEDYILREVEEQVDIFSENVETSLKIAKQLRRIMKEYEETYDEPFLRIKTRKKALEKISYYSETHEFSLRETAWDMIDKEKNVDVLTMLAAYAALDVNEKTFWDWRKHIFETPALWPAMLDEFIKKR